MTFSFSSYLIYTLLLPLAVLVITFPVVIKAVKFLIEVIRDRDFADNWQAIIVAALAVVFCTVPQVYYVSQSYPLITERASDAVEVSGTVESVTAPSKRIPGLRTGSNQGADIVIDGEEYFAMGAAGLETGDEVTILVMPKSKMVLEIETKE